ncbi:Hexaprenyldihydroxybenzoate methyltransferase, mitochondrial [Mortierella sp. GBA30]|nr:Hexaprenyldihydroxybenzoate methyltransferase, mitochondrial [Mortierella sp. GBA30]
MSHQFGRISTRIYRIPKVVSSLKTSRLNQISHFSRRNTILSITTQHHHVSSFSTKTPLNHTHHNNDKSTRPESSSMDQPIHTVNKDEIAKFAAMSDEWWAPQGPFKMLHLMNPARVRYIRNRLEASGAIANVMDNAKVGGDQEQQKQQSRSNKGRFPLQGLSILDVGCGGGLLAEALARLGANVTGLDASIENVEMARIHAKKDPLLNGGAPGSLEYHHQTAEKLLEQGQQFDVVCSLEVIEHVDNPAGFLKVLGQLVKPNGDLILSTVSRTPMSYFLTIFCAEHLLKMVPVGTHHWSKYIMPEELQAGVEDLAKCQVLNIQGIGFNPLSGQWELTRSRDGSQTDGGLLSLVGGPFAEASNYMLAAKRPPSA